VNTQYLETRSEHVLCIVLYNVHASASAQRTAQRRSKRFQAGVVPSSQILKAISIRHQSATFCGRWLPAYVTPRLRLTFSSDGCVHLSLGFNLLCFKIADSNDRWHAWLHRLDASVNDGVALFT